MKENISMEKAVNRAMNLFDVEYKDFEITKSRIKAWITMLDGIDTQAILSAAWLLVEDESPFAPNIGKLKQKALSVQSGALHDKTAVEAWGDVLRKIARDNIELSVITKRALKNVRSIDDLRRVQDLSYDRSWFEKSYNAEMKNYISERSAPPMVKAYLKSKEEPVKAIPASVGTVENNDGEEFILPDGFETKADYLVHLTKGIGG